MSLREKIKKAKRFRKEEFFKAVPKFDRYVVGRDGSVWRWYKTLSVWRRLIPIVEANGYFRIDLCDNGRRRRMLLHRLVLEVFVGSCPDGMECCHGDKGKADNSLSNLRWDTHEANCKERIITNRGEKHHNSKLLDRAVDMIECLAKNRFSLVDLSKEFGVTTGVISRIKSGKRCRVLKFDEGLKRGAG